MTTIPTDDEIVQQITRQCVVAVFLSLLGKKEKAQLFIIHVLRVVAANKDAVERRMKARQLAPRLTDTPPSDIEQRVLCEETELLSESSPFK